MWKNDYNIRLLHSLLWKLSCLKNKTTKPTFVRKLNLSLIVLVFPFSPVFDLLPSASQRLNPSVLQPILTDPTLNELYVISTFKLQSKSSATIFGLYSSADHSKYFEFTVMGRLNKGKQVCRNHFLKNPLCLFQDLVDGGRGRGLSSFLQVVPSTIHFSFQFQILLLVHLPV